MNYFDVLLAKKLEDDRDPKVEGLSVTANGTYSEDGVVYKPVVVNVPETPLSSLSVTANGTYTAPSGTAYNEVDVNVPLPSNAYLLKELSNLPQPIASFSDGAEDLPLKSLTASIVPVQAGSGDPSPTNIRQISGWSGANVSVCGVNVWDEEWEVGDIDAQGNPTPSTTLISTKNFNPCKPSTTYKVVTPSNTSMYMKYYDKDKNFIAPTVAAGSTITTPSNCYYFKFVIDSAYGTTYNNDISINYPSTDTEYHAYAGTTTTIPFTDGQGQSVEVFGGTLDVTSGVLTVEWKSTDLNTLTWTYDSTYSRLTSEVTNIVSGGGARTVEFLCSDYNCIHNREPVTQIPDGSIYTYGDSVYVHDSRYTDGTTFKNSTTAKMVYPMRVTQTIPQHPTSINSLDGENNVFASTGDVTECEYFSRTE